MSTKNADFFTVWNHNEFYNWAACCEQWNLTLFKKHTFILRRTIQIGSQTFIPGNSYGRIGTGKKTSSGFTYYHGEPLIYQGTYENILLFTKKQMPDYTKMGYKALFYSFEIIKEHNCLLTLNNVGSPRLINL